MLRKKLAEKQIGQREAFRWRGQEISRIEGFSDAVFGFAIALLVVSIEVPNSFLNLMQTMQGFAAFAVTFTAIAGIWYVHYRFFRHYGLQDGYTIFLNCALLFVVLFYVYPLKFLFTLLITHGLLNQVLGFNTQVDITMENHQWGVLMLIYSLGFLAIFLIFMLLNFHALRKKAELKLTELEIFRTRTSIRSHAICVVIALISITLVSIDGSENAGLAGWLYALIGPAETINGLIAGKKIRKLRNQTLPAKTDSGTETSPETSRKKQHDHPTESLPPE